VLLELDYARVHPAPSVLPITTQPDIMDTMEVDTMDAMDTDSESEDEPDHQESVISPPTSSSTKKKRLRITKSNPIYGFVEGARRGARKFCESTDIRSVVPNTIQPLSGSVAYAPPFLAPQRHQSDTTVSSPISLAV
jgi:hypothetical protein